MTNKFDYQIKAAKEVLKNALDSNYIASVLAACPSSGKTTISHIIINEYLKIYPKAKVIVLTEGQNVLKEQYLSELNKPNVKIDFSYGDFNSNKQVKIGLPQSIDRLTLNSIDLLVVDECHRYYLEKLDRSILGRFKPKHQVIMTGSPTKFNLHNTNKSLKPYGIYYISAKELQNLGVFSGVDIDLIKIKNKSNPIDSLREVMKRLEGNADLSKLMVACPNVKFAREIALGLNEMGRGAITLCTAIDDASNRQLGAFKDGLTNTLVVVNKGVLGFNDANITCLVDMKASNNLDTSYQLFARILRVHPENKRKAYFRVVSGSWNREVEYLHKMTSLMETDIFRRFTGKNIKIIYENNT